MLQLHHEDESIFQYLGGDELVLPDGQTTVDRGLNVLLTTSASFEGVGSAGFSRTLKDLKWNNLRFRYYYKKALKTRKSYIWTLLKALPLSWHVHYRQIIIFRSVTWRTFPQKILKILGPTFFHKLTGMNNGARWTTYFSVSSSSLMSMHKTSWGLITSGVQLPSGFWKITLTYILIKVCEELDGEDFTIVPWLNT